MELECIVMLEDACNWLKELASIMLKKEGGLTLAAYSGASGNSGVEKSLWKWYNI